MKLPPDESSVIKDFEFESDLEKGNFATVRNLYPLYRARYYTEIGSPLLTHEQHAKLINIVNEIDPEVRHKIIIQNLRIVVSIAKRYTNRGLDLVELIKLGNQALVNTLETIEDEGGLRYTSHVVNCICQGIERTLNSLNQGEILNQLKIPPASDINIKAGIN